MTTRCLDIGAMSRFVHRASELEEVLRVEHHVRGCPRCRDHMERLRRYAENLFEDQSLRSGTATECPSDVQIEHFRRDRLVERQSVRLQEHLSKCPSCRARWEVLWEGEAPVLLRTCRPAIDLRIAPEGVRLADGADLRAPEPWVTCRRLAGPGFDAASATLTAARRLRFRMQRMGLDLEVCVDLKSLEGFRLEIHLWRQARPVHDEVLTLWDRRHVRLRRATADGAWQVDTLLAPGTWFFGASEHSEPWFGLSVEPGLFFPHELAELGYDWCRRAALRTARRCFESAAQADGAAEYRRLLQHTRRFAARFGLGDRDAEIRWARPASAPGRTAPPRREEARALRLERVDDLVRFLQELSRRAEETARPAAPDATWVEVPEARFRKAYRAFLRRQRRLLTRLEELGSRASAAV